MFYKVELVTRKKNIHKHFQVSSSKCDVILRNSVSQLNFVTGEFRTSNIAGFITKLTVDKKLNKLTIQQLQMKQNI